MAKAVGSVIVYEMIAIAYSNKTIESSIFVPTKSPKKFPKAGERLEFEICSQSIGQAEGSVEGAMNKSA